MALQRMPGCNNQWLSALPNIAVTPVLSSVLVLDALADRVTMIGHFTHQDGVPKTVDGVEFLLGATTKAGGSTLQVSLQNVDLVNGPVIREDGIADQIRTIANADAGFVTNAWYGGDFDAAATRSLAPGDLVAVVFQFATFFAGDSVAIRTMSYGGGLSSLNCVVANLTGTYAQQLVLANVILRCSDGTFGTLEQAWPTTAVNTHTYNLNTAGADEYALGVKLPFASRVSGSWIHAAPNVDTDVILYSGTTPLKTVSVDQQALTSNATRLLPVGHPEETLAAAALYRLAVRPLSGATSVSVYSTDVNEAGHLTCLPGGVDFHLWTRLDQGAWGGEVTTRRLLAGVRLSAFDDGAQAITQEQLDAAVAAATLAGTRHQFLGGRTPWP